MAQHLHSVDIPVEGEVPVWATDHWEFDGPVIAEHGLSGDGSSVLPLRVNSKYDWGQGPSGGTGAEAPDLRHWGTDSTMGDPVYVDTAGFVRSMPQVIPDPSSKAAADLPGTYPQGMSIMTLFTATAAAKGWPDGSSCTVVTYRRHGDDDANAIAHQWWYQNQDPNARVMARYGGGPSWTAWHALPLSYADIPANTNLNTYIYPGQYAQITNANASTANNYPVAFAGLLEVGRSADGAIVWQRYTIYAPGGSGATNLTYTRALNGGSWSPWVYLPKAETVVASINNGFTAATGWKITNQLLWRIQTNLMGCHLAVERTGGTIDPGPDGNIGNSVVAVLATTQPVPLMDQCGFASHDTGRTVSAMIFKNRNVTLASIAGDVNLVNTNVISFGGLFPVIP